MAVTEGGNVKVIENSEGERTTPSVVAYTDDGKAGIAAAFDSASLRVLKQIPAAPDADGIVYDPASRHVFVIEGDSGSITVIDPHSNSAVATIKVGAGLEAAEIDGKGKLFVDGVDAHDLIAIDTKTNAVLAHYPMPGCVRPHGIAVDGETRRVFVTCVNKAMIVVDADKGTNLAVEGERCGTACRMAHEEVSLLPIPPVSITTGPVNPGPGRRRFSRPGEAG